ncbi:MAG: glycogen synthase, partial [Nocardioides kribbensis]
GTGTPLDPDRYVADFAAALVEVVSDPDRAAAMGRAGRQRAIGSFSWGAIAARTVEVYRSVL